MREVLNFLTRFRSEAFEILGVLIVALGIGLIYAPAGVIVLGLGLVLVGYALGEDDRTPKGGGPR